MNLMSTPFDPPADLQATRARIVRVLTCSSVRISAPRRTFVNSFRACRTHAQVTKTIDAAYLVPQLQHRSSFIERARKDKLEVRYYLLCKRLLLGLLAINGYMYVHRDLESDIALSDDEANLIPHG
jgi:hypothetical protein